MATLLVPSRPRPLGLPLHIGVPLVLATAIACSIVAFVVSIDWKIAFGAVGSAALLLILVLVQQRRLFILLLLVLSIQVVFHKAIGPLETEFQGGGPPGVYLTTIDVPLLLLYGFWLAEGTLLRDFGRAIRQPTFLLPLLGGLTVLPSLLTAADLTLWMGEFVRLIFGYLLFVYVALKVRTRHQMVWVLGALALVAIVQFGIVLLQARTGSTLGLAALGAGGTEEGGLAFRTIDGGGEIPRPSGTIIHAILLAALMAAIAAIALNLALHLRPWRLRLFWLGVTGIGVAAVVIAMGRAPALGMAVALPLSVMYALHRGRLAWRALGAAAVAGAVGGMVFWDKITTIVSNNVGTDHFWLEVEARVQLNNVAIDMLNSSPLVGVGLNNSALLLDKFEPYGVIFPHFPAHNLYLLVGSETGIIGLFGLLVMLGAPLWPAVRLARSDERFLSALGCGVAASLVTVYFQELLVLALRYDTPRMTFWLLAGLGVAGWRLVERERRRTQARAAQVRAAVTA